MNYWERKEKLFKYTKGVRQFFPLAMEQLDVVARILMNLTSGISSFLDLGCGDGFLGYCIYTLYPNAHGVFMDISSEMIKKAEAMNTGQKSEYNVQDFGKSQWHEALKGKKNFDLIISGYSIHHIDDEQKKRLFKDIYELIRPGGIFINLDHVSSVSKAGEEMFNELFLDKMQEYQEYIKDPKTREEIEDIYVDPNHKKLNRLAPVEKQCQWLRDIGFTQVDCYLKIFELALFGGTKE